MEWRSARLLQRPIGAWELAGSAASLVDCWAGSLLWKELIDEKLQRLFGVEVGIARINFGALPIGSSKVQRRHGRH